MNEKCQAVEPSNCKSEPYRPNKINCDQVAWLKQCFDRYLPAGTQPSICRKREMAQYAMLYEVMEILQLGFADKAARYNGTPIDAREE